MVRNILKYSVYFVVSCVIGAVAAYLFFRVADSGKTGKEPTPAAKSITEEQTVLPGEKSGVGPGLSMPSFEDQLLEEAKMTLANLDIRLGKVTWAHSDTVEKGKIIGQRPLPGSADSKEINVLVSLGAYDVMYRCPSFVNMTIEDARTLSDRLGINLNEQGEGVKVISQAPEEGAIIRKGESVEVTLGSKRTWF